MDTCDNINEHFMREALIEAQLAIDNGEVPIGCVIVYKNEIIGRGHNLRNSKKNPLCHAEISAINQAAEFMGDWRLEDCTLYVTVEPCPMCAGAITNARIRRVVYGAADPKAGCYGSICDFRELPFNHRTEVEGGLLEEECAALLRDFFRALRERKSSSRR